MTSEPSVNDLSPMVPAGMRKEPVVLIDTTGSMSYPVSANSSFQRRNVLREAMGRIVEALAAEDSMAAEEEAAGEDKGGLLAYTFADGNAKELEDLTPDNWQQKWDSIQWGGRTFIVPGWEMLVTGFVTEFHDKPANEKPALLALVVTDGEAEDTDAFASILANRQEDTYVSIAVMGYGTEHDRALSAYQRVGTQNSHVRVITFGNETDPKVISDGLLSLAA